MTNNEMAWAIYDALVAKGADIGNASIGIIESHLDEYFAQLRAERDELLQAARYYRHVSSGDTVYYATKIFGANVTTKQILELEKKADNAIDAALAAHTATDANIPQ